VGFRRPLETAISLDPGGGAAAAVQSEEFDLTITQGGSSTVYRGLSMDAGHPRNVITALAADALVDAELVEPAPASSPPDNLPDDAAATALANGVDEDLGSLDDQDYIQALDTLREIDNVNLVAIPDAAARAGVQQAVIAHCELLHDRFGVLDAGPGLEPFGATSVEAQRNSIDSARGYAALYYPWLRAAPAGGGPPILVPPSGYVCGIMARTDQTRGVHKAPAGIEATVNGAVGVERRLSDDDHGLLNRDSSVNVIRVFRSGGRPVVFGARTTATDRNWQYVNIRRLFLFVEESIAEGIAWAVFEPNNLQLWQKLRRTITEFLTRVWRDGALFGAAPEDAFYVRIDEVLNPFSEQALGRLNLEIGIRPTYPAEFIVVRIGIWPGGSDMSET
jgi:phage tail sheath protein FI